MVHKLENVTQSCTVRRLAALAVHPGLASTSELVFGVTLLVGFATRFAAVPLIVIMCVAIRTALWEQVDGIGSLVGLTEFAYIALLVWLGTNGAGPLSLDRLVARGWHGGAERAAAVAPSRATT